MRRNGGHLQLQTFRFYKRKEFLYHLNVELDTKDETVVYDIHILYLYCVIFRAYDIEVW